MNEARTVGTNATSTQMSIPSALTSLTIRTVKDMRVYGISDMTIAIWFQEIHYASVMGERLRAAELMKDVPKWETHQQYLEAIQLLHGKTRDTAREGYEEIAAATAMAGGDDA